MSAINFLYFDLGNVLINFSHDLMFEQIAGVSGVDRSRIENLLNQERIQLDYESGKLSTDCFHRTFCERTGVDVDLDVLKRASSDIFSPNVPVFSLLTQLRFAGNRLGIISNTCEAHWEWVCQQFSVIPSFFDELVLSFEVGNCKPEPDIYRVAIERAGCPSSEIAFFDDRPEHVEGARHQQIKAFQFDRADRLASRLRSFGLQFNY